MTPPTTETDSETEERDKVETFVFDGEIHAERAYELLNDYSFFITITTILCCGIVALVLQSF